MELKKLVIHGFKSFADRVEVTFEHGITGVVGPNGCGKSNISDAVRWVLGEQSAKSLRGAKMEDVIFGGTEKRRRQAFCEVQLVFDNADHALAIDFAEVMISRRAYRNGDGEYSINGTPCRLKDVIDLFRDTGLGRDGYSIIGQGRVDEILSNKAEERRQIFEEAAGIMKFKARKLESERKIESSRLSLDRVEDILSELNDRIEPLKKQSDEAREYLTLRDELKVLDLNIFLSRSVKYEARIAELKSSLVTLDKELEDVRVNLEQLQKKRDEHQLEYDRLEVSVAEKRDVVQALIRDAESREGEVNLLRERIKASSKDIERLVLQRDGAQNGGGGVQAQIDEMSKELESEKLALEVESIALQESESELSAKEKNLTDKEAENERAKAEIISAMNKLYDVKAQRERLGALKSALDNQLKTFETDTEKDKESLKALNEHVSDAENKLNSEKDALKEASEKVRELVDIVNATGEESRKLSDTMIRIKDSVQQTGSRLKLLTEMQRDYDGLTNSVKQVLYQARRLQNSGVRGVVADIIKTPEKLERALDMVLGGALQNIVVDKDEDAKKMIEYLRANRFGRATFLPISSVRGRTLAADERRVLGMRGCVGLASELISFDSIYQGVIDNLLGRTVIAEDLDSGIAIQRAGRYQFRLVTLEGDVMHSGGSMTGGSVQSRVTNLLSRTREIEEGQKKLNELNEDYNNLKNEFDNLENRRTKLKLERAHAYDSVHEREIAAERAEEYLNAALEERVSFMGRAGKVVQEKERLQDQLRETEEALNGLDETQGAAQGKTDTQQRLVRDMQGVILDMRAEVERLRQEVSDVKVSHASKARDYEAKRRERDALNEKANDLDRLIKEATEQLDLRSAELTENKAALNASESELIDIRSKLNAARDDFASVDGKRVEAQKLIKNASSEIETLRNDAESRQDARHKLDVQYQRAETEYKQLTDRIWDEYEATYSGAEQYRVADFKLTESEKRVSQIRARIREMGLVNVAAMDEYKQTVARVSELDGQREDLVGAITDLEAIIAELEKNMDERFRQQFTIMNLNFKRTFTRLFGGGTAELRMTDPRDALNCGIDIVAQPPGKKLQTLSLLSGGEKALTAIAILFAMLDLRPTPFCILDEIEAALDDANIDNFAEYLKQYSAKTQFVVITHRKGTMERCEALYGVVMEEKGVSKLISVALDNAI